jgi:hypothetical protein
MEKPIAPVGSPAVAQNTDALLSSIRDDHEKIRRGDASAIPSYNYRVARLIDHLEQSGEDPWSTPMTLSGTNGIQRSKDSLQLALHR